MLRSQLYDTIDLYKKIIELYNTRLYIHRTVVLSRLGKDTVTISLKKDTARIKGSFVGKDLWFFHEVPKYWNEKGILHE